MSTQEHWNVQVKIQRVRKQIETELSRPTIVGAAREVSDILNISITADTEEEAYTRAHRLLEANRPERTTLQ